MWLLEKETTHAITVYITNVEGDPFEGEHVYQVQQVDKYGQFAYSDVKVHAPSPPGPPIQQSTASVRLCYLLYYSTAQTN